MFDLKFSFSALILGFAMRECLSFLKWKTINISKQESIYAIMFLFLFLFFISVAAASAEKTQKELDLIKNSEVAADKERSEHRGEHWETLTQREFDLIKNAKEKADKERGGQWRF